MLEFIHNGCSSPILQTPLGTKIVGKKAFSNCSNSTSMFLTEGIIEIKDEAFFNCKRLVTVHLPGTLKVIGKDVFKDLDSLQLITFNGTEEEFSKIQIDNSNEVLETVEFRFNE